MNEVPYPVISLTPLDLHQRRGRGVQGAAPPYPGAIPVFQINNQFVVVSAAEAMNGRIADATSVAMVSLERRRIATAVMLPSRWLHTYVNIEAEFECQVVDASLVLNYGCHDVRPLLQRYLADDPRIRMFAAKADLLDFASTQMWIMAYAFSLNRIKPPFVAGMVCGLANINIGVKHWTPADPALVLDEPNGANGSNSTNANRSNGSGDSKGNSDSKGSAGQNGGGGRGTREENGPAPQDYWEW
jgi:hypothetical protein